jgi:hypothetical protein
MLQDDILKILGDGGAGVAGTDLVLGPSPEQPDTTVAIKVYGGDENDYTFKEGGLASPELERPRFQVVCRAASQLTGWTKARLCRSLLNGFGGTVNGCVYLRIRILGNLQEFSEDGNLFFRVQANYEAQKYPS